MRLAAIAALSVLALLSGTVRAGGGVLPDSKKPSEEERAKAESKRHAVIRLECCGRTTVETIPEEDLEERKRAFEQHRKDHAAAAKKERKKPAKHKLEVAYAGTDPEAAYNRIRDALVKEGKMPPRED